MITKAPLDGVTINQQNLISILCYNISLKEFHSERIAIHLQVTTVSFSGLLGEHIPSFKIELAYITIALKR